MLFSKNSRAKFANFRKLSAVATQRAADRLLDDQHREARLHEADPYRVHLDEIQFLSALAHLGVELSSPVLSPRKSRTLSLLSLFVVGAILLSLFASKQQVSHQDIAITAGFGSLLCFYSAWQTFHGLKQIDSLRLSFLALSDASSLEQLAPAYPLLVALRDKFIALDSKSDAINVARVIDALTMRGMAPHNTFTSS